MWYPKPLLSILLIPLWFGASIDYPGKHCQIGRTLVFIVLPYILHRCCNTSLKRLILAVSIFFFDNFFSEAGCNADWPDEYTLVIYMFFAGDGFSLYVIVNFSGLWCFYISSFVGNFFYGNEHGSTKWKKCWNKLWPYRLFNDSWTILASCVVLINYGL